MSQTVDRIISIFKAMSRVEKIELVTAIATDPDVKAEVEALSPKPTAAASSGGKRRFKTKAKSSWWIKSFTGVSNEDASGKKLKGTFRADGVFIKNYAEKLGVGDFCIVHSRVNEEYTVCEYTKGSSDQVSVPNEDGTEVVFAGLLAHNSYDNANALCDEWASKL